VVGLCIALFVLTNFISIVDSDVPRLFSWLDLATAAAHTPGLMDAYDKFTAAFDIHGSTKVTHPSGGVLK